MKTETACQIDQLSEEYYRLEFVVAEMMSSALLDISFEVYQNNNLLFCTPKEEIVHTEIFLETPDGYSYMFPGSEALYRYVSLLGQELLESVRFEFVNPYTGQYVSFGLINTEIETNLDKRKLKYLRNLLADRKQAIQKLSKQKESQQADIIEEVNILKTYAEVAGERL